MLAAVMLLAPMAGSLSSLKAAEGNADFENESNYDAYSVGNGKIHVKVLLFSERGYDYNAGRGNNQNLGNNPDPTRDATGSRMYTDKKNGDRTIQLYYWADNYYNNTGASNKHHWPKDKGVVWVQLWGGVVECTNTYDGIKRTVVADGTVQQIEVKRKDEGYHLTWFEFDWYPPEELDEEDFKLYVTTDHHQWNQSGFKTKTYDFGVFTGANEQMAPTICEPFIYAANENGVAGYGKLATVYTSISEVNAYYTSQDLTERALAASSGMVYIEPTDTVIRGFRVRFHEKRTSDNTTWRWVWTNKVDVPAYHRIHAFAVRPYQYRHEENGKWYVDYRYKQLSWQIQHPNEADVMEGDVFEIQRAYRADFSDAETIEAIPMVYDSTKTDAATQMQTYTYVDLTEGAWWNPVENSYTIYYRIRRASSAIWGWNPGPYNAVDSMTISSGYEQYTPGCFRDNAPFNYTVDADFETNRAVHFTWEMANGNCSSGRDSLYPGYSYHYWDAKQRLMLRKIMTEREDTILIEVPQETIRKAYDSLFYHTDNTPYSVGRIYIHYTDYANTPCVHYQYETYIDTTDVTVKNLRGKDERTTAVHPFNGPAIYYTEAANINVFAGTDKEYSEYVLLTWEPTEGETGTYAVDARPNAESQWQNLVSGITDSWYRDTYADPEQGDPWQYRLTMTYECNGSTLTRSTETTGRRNPYGKISGRIAYSDGTGCPGIEVNASRVSDGLVVQRVQTDENGYYLLDSVLYGGSPQYAVTPVSQNAEFRYNNTSATFATITLSLDRCVAQNIDFENISSVRVSGRVLYENSTIPMRDANFLVNGKLVMINGHVYKSDASGNFEFMVPKGEGFTLQAIKDGHWFAGEGFVRMEGDSLLTLTKALDGIRIYDQTKVRLIGRLAGGDIQGTKPLGHGLSTNYLGADLKMVFELEGDNISRFVHYDDERDTVWQHVDATNTLFEKKRITIQPDVATGEFAVDLFPVKYKITQATARGYATLFSEGKTSETLDLTNAPTTEKESVVGNDTVRYNADYSITYHSPIDITCTQLLYGRDLKYYGEVMMRRQNIANVMEEVPLATKKSDGTYEYLFGAPVFAMRKYNFRVTAHEDYYYNNDELSAKHEEVRINGGTLKVYNGLFSGEKSDIKTYQLDTLGQAEIEVEANNVSFLLQGEDAQRPLDLSVEYKGAYVEKQAFRAYVTGNKKKGRDFVASTHGKLVLLDILRDPPGKGYAFIEEGTTYRYNYTYNFNFTFGMSLNLGIGSSTKLNMGVFAGTGAGTYAGYWTDFSTVRTFSLPISTSYTCKQSASYTFTTSERIETYSGAYPHGQDADVYIGAVQNIYYGTTDAVKPIDSLTYATMQARYANGTMNTVSSGRDAQGKLWYLVIGEETEVGTYIDATFIYTHAYIENTLLPKLKEQRDALIYTGDSATVQSIADATGKPVYWSLVATDDEHFADSTYYRMLRPTGDTKMYDDEVASYNNQIADWYGLFLRNETEKINAIYGRQHTKVGTWSVSGGTSLTHTETYDYGSSYTKRVDYPNFSLKINPQTIKGVGGLFGQSITNKLNNMYESLSFQNAQGHNEAVDPSAIATSSPGVQWTFSITPILDMNFDYVPEGGSSRNKKAGFVLKSDDAGSQTVSVWRVVNKKEDFNAGSDDIRDFMEQNNSGGNYNDLHPDSLYGSYVFFTEGGASRCPYEPEVKTEWYEPELTLSQPTLKIEDQKISLDVHERSNVPVDQPAIFHVTMRNESEHHYLVDALPLAFNLKAKDASNPHGARLEMDGKPLTEEGREVKLGPGVVITKTLYVYAGEGYDFENLTLSLASECDRLNHPQVSFSVHYMPVASPVNITTPHDKWVMNTVSPQDSAGWYLPVTIDGFDVNYRGFDHIEFQYKLATQSDDAWVNQCSYYYDDSLYNAASGNKAMITSGRIENIRFYGERDPMEQQYDLRAVTFCRHGNGFITRSSAVLTGIKDTRPPRVFGQPEPADAILGVGDNLLLRFNEPIAGNYLDEDNNFQLMGITNSTGITTGASLFFSGQGAYAESKAWRSFADKSFTIDLLVKPTETDQDEVFFLHGDGQDLLLFGKNTFRKNGSSGYDNCLSLVVGNTTFYSKPLDAPMTDFTRVIVTYDIETRTVRFYAGTKDMTNYDAEQEPFEHNITAPLNFGMGLMGNLLEARVWTKALTPAEIANTHMKYLTGAERELLAYYPMNEGEGETLTDKANGATLFVHGADWTFEKGISLHVPATDSVELAGDLLARSSIQDETLMFWFRTHGDGHLFRSASGFGLSIEDGELVLKNNNHLSPITNHQCTDGAWHHLVLTIDRTHNNVALFVDQQLLLTTPAVDFVSISGRMFLGGGGFEGNFDELAVFEQALPKNFIDDFAHLSLYGDEMGLMAYLPFEEDKENNNGIIERVFSINDQRQFKTSDGTIIEKEVPLIINDKSQITNLADKANSAPVRSQGQLTKLNFDWSFNGDELMINLNMQDREINKQTIYVTVRDVEDLNGNPMTSPVTWTAFVDHNSLKWEDDDLELSTTYGENLGGTAYVDFQIINNSGKRHQYTIESVPDWLTISPTYGSIDPMKDKTIRIYYNINIPVGKYTDVIYLTDEQGLSEPLEVIFTVDANPPYETIDEGKYPLNMSLCGQVKIGDEYDTDNQDIVYALYRSECIGMANVAYNELTHVSEVFLTVQGSEAMTNKQISFQLWQASTGKLLDLTPSTSITFAHGRVWGCGTEPVVFTTAGSEVQNIDLKAGWTWVSFNLDLQPSTAQLSRVLSAAEPWTEGDLIKNPATQHFVTYSEVQDAFLGQFSYLRNIYTYMVYCKNGNTMRINGEPLAEADKTITLRGDGQWSPLPCLFDQATLLSEALTDYYQKATQGDLIKAQNRFAVFSADGHWVGDLKALRPGEGYFFRRMGAGDVTVRFYNQTTNAPKKVQNEQSPMTNDQWSSRAATNMTMICTLSGEAGLYSVSPKDGLYAYIGSELVGVATKIDSLYFLTISSDAFGSELRFETEDGLALEIEPSSLQGGDGGRLVYVADSHHGSLKAPVILTPSPSGEGWGEAPYKIIENNHVIIIRNNEKYDITGKKL